ncbi:MAG: hypothetical protein K6F00_03600 [Lachnospiraceae bacterium]|nr:hypothetical protein [Lachnospiraceae bacterium]
MENEIQKDEEVFVSEDELITSAVTPLTYSLANILVRVFKTDDVNVTVGANGLPAIDVFYQNYAIKFSFFPTGETDAFDMFVLMIRAGVKMEDETNAILACESFNTASLFGYGVYVGDGYCELRASVPHEGRIYDENYYNRLMEMFVYSLEELNSTLNEKE